jgi:hypothetical protein
MQPSLVTIAYLGSANRKWPFNDVVIPNVGLEILTGGGYEKYCFLRYVYNAVRSTESQVMFRRNISPPSSARNRHEAGSKHTMLPASCWFLACLFLTLKMEATRFIETSVDFKRTTRLIYQQLGHFLILFSSRYYEVAISVQFKHGKCLLS